MLWDKDGNCLHTGAVFHNGHVQVEVVSIHTEITIKHCNDCGEDWFVLDRGVIEWRSLAYSPKKE